RVLVEAGSRRGRDQPAQPALPGGGPPHAKAANGVRVTFHAEHLPAAQVRGPGAGGPATVSPRPWCFLPPPLVREGGGTPHPVAATPAPPTPALPHQGGGSEKQPRPGAEPLPPAGRPTNWSGQRGTSSTAARQDAKAAAYSSRFHILAVVAWSIGHPQATRA